jgi:phospholipid/cholesterol/gamma-HCH transport system permease protein
MVPPQFDLSERPGGVDCRLAGDWRIDGIDRLVPVLAAVSRPVGGEAVFDGAAIASLDLTGAWVLNGMERRLRAAGATVRWSTPRPDLLAFVDEIQSGAAPADLETKGDGLGVIRPLAHVGRLTVAMGRAGVAALHFYGEAVTVIGGCLRDPRRFRWPSVARHVYETGVTAVPIVALIAFLISVIVAYIGAQQLRQFGGEVFVVDLVTISVLRELGVLLTAIIVAGRSGSAFAAEIGVMKLNDEVDALAAMGMHPLEVLVLPRLLGLIIALPALTVVADAMGLAGGALLSWFLLEIPFTQYMVRMDEAIASTTFWVGIVKAPVFAFLIAFVGTLRGMEVRGSSRELGRLTTVAVVQSIFLVIFADAIFAVIFMELDI